MTEYLGVIGFIIGYSLAIIQFIIMSKLNK